jgi:uncharacterized membrane protein YdjX (TVP38/TMEM64 family)
MLSGTPTRTLDEPLRPAGRVSVRTHPEADLRLLAIVAGCTRYNIFRFAAATFAGRLLRCLLLSYTGYTLLPLLSPF